MPDLVKTRGQGKPASTLWLQLDLEANRVLVEGCVEPCIGREKDCDHTKSEGPPRWSQPSQDLTALILRALQR